MIMRAGYLLLFFCFFTICSARAQNAFVTGTVQDGNGKPIEFVNVTLAGEAAGATTDPKGHYRMEVPAGKRITLVYSFVNSNSEKRQLKLSPGETSTVDVVLKERSTMIDEFVMRGFRGSTDPFSLQILNSVDLRQMAGPGDGVSTAIKSIVGSNNELTSQYAVRGGNFDENLVYVNDFEIYRPYLVSSGQQEGLSFVNSDLVSNISFSLGGFQAKYGDKMSSVLDVTYRRPTRFAGTVMASLLGASLSLEGASKNDKFTYLVGLRQKSNQYLLQSQPTKGVYNPSFTDVQVLLNYRFNPRWQVEAIGNYARNRFSLQPEESTTSFGVIDQAYQLRVFYTGNEIDQFDSRFAGISVTHKPTDRLRLKLLASGFQTDERETYDINGEYLLGALETDLGKASFGQIKYAIGTGIIQRFARNYLKVNVGTIAHRGSYDGGKHYILWGVDASATSIDDRLHQWERRDSAGYTQPYNPDELTMRRYYNSTADFTYTRYTAFLQDNFRIGSDSDHINVSAGVRVLYSDLNGELDISPRLQATYKPKRDMLLKAAVGLYVQPPFYREMRAFDGTVNTDLKAQKSLHIVAGTEHNFKWAGRPLKLTTEAYYKQLTDLVPYVYEDVRIRYSARNNSKGYAYGGEVRLYGELVKDATSWVSVGVLNTREDLTDDTKVFKGYDGKDSVTIYPGYTPRPNDQRAMVGLYLQDYLPRNKNFKVNINLLYATGLPFYQPDGSRYGPILRLPDYKRVDIGFSALLLDGARRERPRYSFFSNLNSIWASLEVFNLLGIQNTLSYTYVQDQTSGKAFAVPNRLTSRLLNVKVIVRF